jgi:tRNA nucleotidyltransferase/poly(A) polymerase
MENSEMKHGITFKKYICFKEGKENFEQPHVITADPPLKIPGGIERISDAFKRSKEVSIGKEVDPKAGGEKDVTMKAKKLFIVGGAVRDYLLGHTPSNYDLATDAHPEEVERIMMGSRPPIQVVKKDPKNGIVRVSVDGETYDIETMRLPTMPDSEGGNTFTANPQDDALRRDVTVNSLYYEPSSKKIYDYTGGLRHLKDGAVKFIGKAEDRVKEDGMRKFRYARMLNKIPNAVADDEAKEAITKNSDMEDLPPEKIRDEFWRGMEDLHSNPVKFLKTYHDLGLLQTVFPKLELSFEFPDCKTAKTRPIVLASLLKKNKPQKLVAKLKELKYTDREIKDAVFLINLLLFKPEYIYDFKQEMMKTSLTKRQMLDWAKINNLNVDMIEKLVNHKFTVNPSEVMQSSGLQGEDLRKHVKHAEAQAFMKSMREAHNS